MGYGVLEHMIKDCANAYDNISYHDAVDQSILIDYTASADIGFCFIENSCLSYYYCLPNKFFEYTMAGIPIVASNLFEIKRIIDENGNGIVTETNDIDGLTLAVKSITTESLTSMNANIPLMKKKYNWEAQEEQLLAAYTNARMHK